MPPKIYMDIPILHVPTVTNRFIYLSTATNSMSVSFVHLNYTFLSRKQIYQQAHDSYTSFIFFLEDYV